MSAIDETAVGAGFDPAERGPARRPAADPEPPADPDPPPCPEETAGVTADDFAAALAGALDRLQTRLAETRNAVSHFAVREMTVEAAVVLSVDRLGRLRYRFPTDDVPPPVCLSRVTLRIAATPPDGTAGVWRRNLFDPAVEVEKVPGIGRAIALQLHRHGVDTVGDLAEVGSRGRIRVELATILRVDRARITNWVRRAELLAVRGLGVGHLRVLEHLGVGSLEALAGKPVAELVSAFNQVAGRKPFEEVGPIGSGEAACWIEAAASFLGEGPQLARCKAGDLPPADSSPPVAPETEEASAPD